MSETDHTQALSCDQGNLSIAGRKVPAVSIGCLSESTIEDDLKDNLLNKGYVFIRRAIEPESIIRAKRFVWQQLASVDEVEPDESQAIATGRSSRRERHPDLGRFWQQISESPELRQCVHAESLYRVFGKLFQQPAQPFDFVWLRVFARGTTSPLHIDHPYMNRGTRNVVSCWIPLGDVNPEGGGLFLVENSNQIQWLRDEFDSHDVDLDGGKPGYISDHALEFATRNDRRLLSARFKAGDILIFDHFTAHAAFDNEDQSGRVRISCDTRWQPDTECMDERFRGPNPSAHGGLGYACLAASKPLTERTTPRQAQQGDHALSTTAESWSAD